jgi:Tfp pilus assembly protein PilF
VCGLFNFTGQTAAAGPLGVFLLGWLDTALARTGGSPSVPAHRSARVVALACLFLSAGALAWWGRMAALSLLLAGDGAEARVAAGLRPGSLFPRERAVVGGFLARAGRWPEARAELEAAFARQREVTLLNNLGHVAFQQGRFAEGAGYYRIWADSGVQHARALSNLSLAAEQAGDPGAAMLALERVYRFWPDQPESELRRVAALGLRSGRVAPAARILDRWLKAARLHGLTPAAETWNARGSLARASGERGRARECFQTALRLNPRLESARRNLAAMAEAGAR